MVLPKLDRLRKPRIAILDADSVSLLIAQTSLKKAGAEVTSFTNGFEFLSTRCEGEFWDLIMVESTLRGKKDWTDGVNLVAALANRVKETENEKQTRLCMMSCDRFPSQAQQQKLDMIGCPVFVKRISFAQDIMRWFLMNKQSVGLTCPGHVQLPLADEHREKAKMALLRGDRPEALDTLQTEGVDVLLGNCSVQAWGTGEASHAPTEEICMLKPGMWFGDLRCLRADSTLIARRDQTMTMIVAPSDLAAAKARQGQPLGFQLKDLNFSLNGFDQFSKMFFCVDPNKRVYTARCLSILDNHQITRVIAGSVYTKSELLGMQHQQELSLLQMLAHPMILEVVTELQDRSHIYILMKPVYGQFSTFLATHKTLGELDSRFYIANLICALEYLHGKHFVYRKLMPECVLMGNTGFLKLADVGSVKQLSCSSGRTFTQQTSENCYQAPEMRSPAGHGKPADMWSLGVFACLMLTGNVPASIAESVLASSDNPLRSRLGELPFIQLSETAIDFVCSLLSFKSENRLGFAVEKGLDVKQHSWLTQCDWGSLERLEGEPPFVPAPDSSWQENLEYMPYHVFQDILVSKALSKNVKDPDQRPRTKDAEESATAANLPKLREPNIESALADMTQKLHRAIPNVTTASSQDAADIRTAMARVSKHCDSNICFTITDMTQEDQPLVFVDENFLKIFGYTMGEVLGRNCRFLQGPSRQPSNYQAISEMKSAFAGHREVKVKLDNFSKMGQAIENHLHLVPLFDRAGKLAYYAGFQHTATAPKHRKRRKSVFDESNNLGFTEGDLMDVIERLTPADSGVSGTAPISPRRPSQAELSSLASSIADQEGKMATMSTHLTKAVMHSEMRKMCQPLLVGCPEKAIHLAVRGVAELWDTPGGRSRYIATRNRKQAQSDNLRCFRAALQTSVFSGTRSFYPKCCFHWSWYMSMCMLNVLVFLTVFRMGAGSTLGDACNCPVAVGFAKAFAWVFMLNTAAALLTRMLSAHTWAQNRWIANLIPLEKLPKTIHKATGCVAALAGCAHTLCHLVSTLPSALSNNQCMEHMLSIYSGWLAFNDLPPSLYLIGSIMGITGSFCFILLVLISVTAQRWVRGLMSHESFLKFHQLYVPMAALVFMHAPLGATIMFAAPLIMLTADMHRSKQKNCTIHVEQVEGIGICKITVESGFVARSSGPGQWCRLHLNEVGPGEWHPFSLASSTYSPKQVFFVQACGEWTNKLLSFAQAQVRSHMAGEDVILGIGLNPTSVQTNIESQFGVCPNRDSTAHAATGNHCLHKNPISAVDTRTRQAKTRGANIRATSNLMGGTPMAHTNLSPEAAERNLLGPDSEGPNAPVTMSAQIEGPFASQTEHMLLKEHVVIVTAGIGITPYLSALATLADALDYSLLHGADPGCKLKSLTLHWVSGVAAIFQLIDAELLDRLFEHARQDRLAFKCHMYGTALPNDITSILFMDACHALHSSGVLQQSMFDERVKLYNGRPNWEEMLETALYETLDLHVTQSTGLEDSTCSELLTELQIHVFYCGPSHLGKLLDLKVRSSKFVGSYHVCKEIFG